MAASALGYRAAALPLHGFSWGSAFSQMGLVLILQTEFWRLLSSKSRQPSMSPGDRRHFAQVSAGARGPPGLLEEADCWPAPSGQLLLPAQAAPRLAGWVIRLIPHDESLECRVRLALQNAPHLHFARVALWTPSSQAALGGAVVLARPRAPHRRRKGKPCVGSRRWHPARPGSLSSTIGDPLLNMVRHRAESHGLALLALASARWAGWPPACRVSPTCGGAGGWPWRWRSSPARCSTP